MMRYIPKMYTIPQACKLLTKWCERLLKGDWLPKFESSDVIKALNVWLYHKTIMGICYFFISILCIKIIYNDNRYKHFRVMYQYRKQGNNILVYSMSFCKKIIWVLYIKIMIFLHTVCIVHLCAWFSLWNGCVEKVIHHQYLQYVN